MKKLIICVILSLFSVNIFSLTHIKVTGTTDNIDVTKTFIVLKIVPRNSTVNIVLINNPGGSLDNGYKIYSLLSEFKLHKNLKYNFTIKGYCHSMCTLLLSMANKVNIKNSTKMIFHTIQRCDILRCYPLIKGPIIDTFYGIFGRYFKDVLTKSQYKRLVKGEDVMITGKQFKERYLK